jgi:dienelactone hydrolase
MPFDPGADRRRRSGAIDRRRFLLATAALFGATGVASARTSGRSVDRIDLGEGGIVGTLFVPSDATENPAVVSLAGAMGGLWEAPARALAEAGFAALALATHGFPGLPPRLSRVPIEPVEAAIELVRRRARPRGGLVALRGWSRGGELALLTASLVPTVAAVVAYAPRCYVALEHGRPNNFGDPDAAPAWTRGRVALEGVPLPIAMRADPDHPTLEDLHGIAVERIAGPVMLVSGAADTGLAGTTASRGCRSVMRRLDLFGVPHRRVHLDFPDAGHAIAEPPPSRGPAGEGGGLTGDAAAIARSWPESLAFLATLRGEIRP